jgi:nitrate reductase gamma subunit
MSHLLYFFENELQIAALTFLAVVYFVRLGWILRFSTKREKTFPAGNTNIGVIYSLFNVALPWNMESIRRKPFFYIQFLIFHFGVLAAISATFIIPYNPKLFENGSVVLLFRIVLAAACIVGFQRMFRRLRNRALRLISTPDDYFALALMTVYFASAYLAIPNRYHAAEWPLLIFFGLTAFFLMYVPFSKICHYLYYPFTRFFLGRTWGHRGFVAKPKIRKEI